MVTLQSCILDNEASLSDVVLQIDKILEGDAVSALVSRVLILTNFLLLPFHLLVYLLSECFDLVLKLDD